MLFAKEVKPVRPRLYYRWWWLMRGDHVRNLQEVLAANGYNPGPIDGIFGKLTREAVIAFQRDQGLAVDGIVGPRTWAALEALVESPAGIGYRGFLRTLAGRKVQFHLLELERNIVAVRILGEPRKLQTLSAMARGYDAAVSGMFFYNTAPIGTLLREGWTWTTEHPAYCTVDLDRWQLYPKGTPAMDLLKSGVQNCISGQPELLPHTSRPDSASLEGRGPRCALGWNDKQVFALVADGRNLKSAGATLPEMAQVLREFGATYAMGLDGGGTAQMMYQGRTVNSPADGRERLMPVGLGFISRVGKKSKLCVGSWI
jgi:hypothetical protein